MKLTKKKTGLIVIAAVIAVVLCGICAMVYLVKTLNTFLAFSYDGTPSYSEEYCSFTPEDTYSYDGKLVAHQKVEEGGGVKNIIVEIKDSQTGELAGSFSPARAWDFWGICWENDSYNIWTQSGDIGVYCWRYQDGVWECDFSHPERPDYIISKYDKYKE